MDKWNFCDKCQVKPYLVQAENEVKSSLPLPESKVRPGPTSIRYTLGPIQPYIAYATVPYAPLINPAPRPYRAPMGMWSLPNSAKA